MPKRTEGAILAKLEAWLVSEMADAYRKENEANPSGWSLRDKWYQRGRREGLAAARIQLRELAGAAIGGKQCSSKKR